jgi:uncharacterized protein (TIGR02145 family)
MMTSDKALSKIRSMQVFVVPIVLVMTFRPISASLMRLSAQEQRASRSEYSTKQMGDGKEWTTQNLDLNIVPSYCYEDSELNCHRYGRLYTWESARQACQSLGNGWRLPMDDDWRQLARRYGGVSEDSDDNGKAAYKALSAGGSSGFNALLGGGRSDDGQYSRKEAHGFYWTSSESDPANGWFYNFALGGQALHRQSGGEKQRALSVRCVSK